MEYTFLEDKELVDLARNGDSNATFILLERCKGLVRSVSRSLFLAGGDSEDLIQEGMIGVYKAISTYNGKSSFKSYAYLCIKSSILTAIRNSSAKKNLPLNSYISLTTLGEEDDKKDIMIDSSVNPETELINKEALNELKTSIKQVLSKFEFIVLSMYLNGNSLEEIYEKTGKNQKAVENALHRIRKKISKILVK